MEANMLLMRFLEETGPNTELSWLLYLFLAFFLLMVIVGWWASRRGGKQPEVTSEMQDHHEAEHTAYSDVNAPVAAPVEVIPEARVYLESVARPEPPAALDDLVRLEGIGPRVAKVLNDAGITTFAALAAADPVAIQKMLTAAGLQMMNPDGWIEQAALAARGDWEELEKLQNELKGGRRR
jgi:predicted flap endonuclease-1-like 5' DNA nuclease